MVCIGVDYFLFFCELLVLFDDMSSLIRSFYYMFKDEVMKEW